MCGNGCLPPLARFPNLEALNAWLEIRCRELALRKHPTASSTIAECFAREQATLRPIAMPFDGYVEQMLRVSSTCLVSLDRNRYSAPAGFAGRVVSVRSSANRVRIVADGELIAEHVRRYGRDQLIYDPWHYLPILEKKPGALRNGAPFVEWELPPPIKMVRDRILKQTRGDRAFVELLIASREVGLEPLTEAFELALETGSFNAAVVLNELRRLTASSPPVALSLPEQLKLRVEPLADCRR